METAGSASAILSDLHEGLWDGKAECGRADSGGGSVSDRGASESKGALVDPTFFFHSITANIICSIVFGKRFHYQDQEFLKMLNLFARVFSLITLDDQAKMPYTEAVIHEIQRFADLLPMGVPHIVTQQTSFRGYIIPKDTEVYLILSTALHDPHYFEKPDAFNPDHFLDASGALKKNEAFIPFSLGIAHNELFLFFTTILQNFVASPVAPEDIDLTPQESGVGKIPPTYQIRFLPR
ncbi:hypothetical protein H8958_015673 [Nasalis larvatus]